MHVNKRIAIILTDTLQSLGLQNLLSEYFPPVEVQQFPTFQELSTHSSDTFDYYFTQPEIFILNSDFFLPRRSKTIILTCNSQPDTSNNSLMLNICSPQESILELLEKLFITDNNTPLSHEASKGLSTRETDVLQLIVKGGTNKEIADKLNISLNTVLSHRKNITAKLGIKTVSGLTFYAIMNGLISGDDIEL